MNYCFFKITYCIQTLLDAIQNNVNTGRPESLNHIFDDRPVMTREIRKDDRLAYIEKTIRSLF